MQLFLVRHGQSFNNTLPDGKGRVADPPLTDIGEKQAPLVAQHLASGSAKNPYHGDGPSGGFDITRLFTSAHLRCLQTSEPIGEALGMEPEIWVDVHEECGIWMDEVDKLPGMTRSEIADRFPRVVIPDEIGEEGWWNRPKETEAEWVERAQRVADELWNVYAETEERIAIVAHGGFIKDLLSALIVGGPLSNAHISSRNTSITHLSFADDQLFVGSVNCVDHLAAELVT